MATATDELNLLERVSLCLGCADTDDKLQSSVCKFLPPVLQKISSPHADVRKKVMGLLIHITKRLKSRPKVQLPVEALLLQYQDPAANTFVINFTIIYIKLGYPRMEMKKQVELVSSVLNSIKGKPLLHQDSLIFLIMPAVGHIQAPIIADKRAALLSLEDKPYVAKQLILFMLDMLLLPYGAVGQTDGQQSGQPIDWSKYPVPPGLSEYSFKRAIGETPLLPAELEQVKLGIVKFITTGFFPRNGILIHLIVAAADTRFSVANLADMELRKLVGSLDWSSTLLAQPLYMVFLGSSSFVQENHLKPEMKRLPANTRIRLKLLEYLCRVSRNGFIIPAATQVIFDSLYGNNTNQKLKYLALDFTLNLIDQPSYQTYSQLSTTIVTGLLKLMSAEDPKLQAMTYTIIARLVGKTRKVLKTNLSIVMKYFHSLANVKDNLELKRTIRDALVLMEPALVFDRENTVGIEKMNSILTDHIESEDSYARYVAVRYASTLFPSDDIPSKYLLLLACGDEKSEFSSEAIEALYATANKNSPQNVGPSPESVEPHKSDEEPALPPFPNLVLYINSQMSTRITSNQVISVGNHSLPYKVATFSAIISYLRFCLAKSANVNTRRTPGDSHPCEYTPLIGRYLKQLLQTDSKSIDAYLEIINCLNHVTSDTVPLNALLEVVGSLSPDMLDKFAEELKFLKGLLASTKEDVRVLAGKIHAIIMAHQSNLEEFEYRVSELIAATKHKTLEIQHGALLALSFMFERKLFLRKATDDKESILSWKPYIDGVKTICEFLKSNTPSLIEAAAQGIGNIAKSFSLPLKNDDGDNLSKKSIVETLFGILKNTKMNHRVKENATTSLGLLCLGEDFPYAKDIIEQFLALTKETKDSSVHFIIAEALVLSVQGPAATEARDAWETLPEEHQIPFTPHNDSLLEYLLDRLLKTVSDPHPNSRQAVCIWLLAVLRRNAKRRHILDRLPAIQSAFMDFLSENNDLVQDVASKGICLVYETSEVSQRDALVSNLLNQFCEGRRTVAQVTPDTKLFEDGQLGKSPTGGNISTYKEICSLASDLNNPSLIYKFLQLANHNAVWNSKRGAAFGFSAIASIAKNELNKYLPSIVPKLYRYQFDPTPKIQQSMTSIWYAIVPSTQKVLEQYHDEILQDIIPNLTNHMYRVRISCCEALADVLKSNARIDYVKHAPEIWRQLFRVMDDIHEGTRQTATKTATLFSKVCLRQCDPKSGKSGEQIVQAILPVLLNIGIVDTVTSVRALSVQTVAQLVSTAGPLLKPSLVNLIPALLTATDLENTKLTYMSNVYGAQSDVQEAIDSVRTSAAKSHYATEALKRCTLYIDAEILKDLMPKVIELMRSSIGLGSKVAVSHFLIFLMIQSKQELQPYAGKILTALMNGLLDRNAAVKKTNAVTIGHVVGSAKDSSLEKLFNTLNTWYMEKEDDSYRLAIGQTFQSINNHNHEVLKKFSDIIMPLVFFAMHAVKVPGNENTIELWTELWGDIAHGTESAIQQNLELITSKLSSALESASWTIKAQAANAVSTVATKIGSSMDDNSRNGLLMVLINGLQGRTWNGKETLVQALATLACNSKESLSKNPELTMAITEALHKESCKANIEYRRHALEAFADVLHELEVDRFTQLYDIAQDILIKMAKKNDDDDSDNYTTEESSKRREDQMKLQETVYKALGKAWPSSIEHKSTQDEYCLQFVTHCHETLVNSTRPTQVAIMTTLTLFVEKLVILKLTTEELTENDKQKLHQICETLHQILKGAVGISTYTNIRKKALDVILILSKKLIDQNNSEQLEKIKKLFSELLHDFSRDKQPEMRTRVADIKSILQIE
ncbi:proteasome-associated protein ECM29 homolog [Fopius arisanus]|uniref:Proteasome-associated protein ECM29 homolog n=1 Tax=Fopius arisanus TaxID=64838 RepID=A0A9R1U566_9HYME|nr:PREDICTED: proteasome-associated protein ECM29 homolog [Fopius arisanus]